MSPSIKENCVLDDVGIPVIELSGEDDETLIAENLVAALRTIGFATIVGHGVDASVVKSAQTASKEFFELDLQTKQKYGYMGHASNRGYIALGNESHQDFVARESKEVFDIGKEGEPGFVTPWPEELSSTGFRKDMLHYIDCFDALHLRLLRLIAIGLKMPDENFFVDRCNQQHINLRLLHYPSIVRNKENAAAGELLVRGARHTDFGTLTLLTQDQIGGLRVQRLGGSWIFVPPPTDGGIVINVGDMLQRWTNDVLRATPHQVVELNKENEEKESYVVPERYSIAFFCNANKEVMLEPLVSLSPGEPAKYEPVKSHDYLTSRLSATISKDD